MRRARVSYDLSELPERVVLASFLDGALPEDLTQVQDHRIPLGTQTRCLGRVQGIILVVLLDVHIVEVNSNLFPVVAGGDLPR